MEMAFVNLPVRDLASATRSDEAIGFRRSPRVSGERASSVTCSDSVAFQRLERERDATFVPKPTADAPCCTSRLVGRLGVGWRGGEPSNQEGRPPCVKIGT
jgi:predicted lactoylglutathione lyase